MLIGLRNSACYMDGKRNSGKIYISCRASFGYGWGIHGTHGSLSFGGLDAHPFVLCRASRFTECGGWTSLACIRFSTWPPPWIAAAEFQELNELGTMPAPACIKYSSCADCTFRRKRLSREDQAVVSRIGETRQVDQVSGTISCKYPWKPCVRRYEKQ